MESSNVIPTYLNEEDILASLLDTPSNCFDLCLSDLTPSPGACLPEVKLDRESGELEDEGFEDCIEDEESALQRDSDPSLAATTIPLNSINTTGLDAFFPLNEHAEDDVFMTTSVSLVDELFDLDQGVAMEANELPVVTSCSDLDSLHDLTSSLCNPSPSLSPTPPLFSLSHSPSFYYPQPIPPSLISATQGASPVPESTFIRQDNDLDYLYTLIQSDSLIVNSSDNYNRDLPISPHRTEHGLIDKLMSTPVNDYSIPLDTINSIPLVDSSGNGWNTTDYRNNSIDSQTERRHSPSPSLTYPIPSPASSVNTDYPESEFGKDLASPDVPNSLTGVNKFDIIEMPFYEFKKLVDTNSISERDKDEVKAIRKRGKNKMAAKNCRHRKLELLGTLQQDIDQLKGKKARLALKALSLQREIEGYKGKYTRTHLTEQHRRLISTIVH